MYDVSLQVDESWLTSLKTLDSCKRRFAATLNRTKVFEAVIRTTLQPSHCTVISGDGPDRQAAINSGVSNVRDALMLNCPVLVRNKVPDLTATHLRQLLVCQHIRALLSYARSVTTHQSYFTLKTRSCIGAQNPRQLSARSRDAPILHIVDICLLTYTQRTIKML